KLLQFDVHAMDIVDTGMFPVGWTDGQTIADKLFINPVGLTGELDGSSLRFEVPSYVVLFEPVLDDPETLVPTLKFSGAGITIRIDPVAEKLAAVRIYSSSASEFDGPIYVTNSPGLLARLVPEPTTMWLVATGFAIVLVRRRCGSLLS